MKILAPTLPYLLLVSFGVQFDSLDQQKINLINQSPYHGVAVPLISAYDSRKYCLNDFYKAIKRIKNQAKKQIWPWVFFNRFIGFREDGRFISPLAKDSYFHHIKGMDLHNQAGALGDFYRLWRISLKIAREIGSPGVFVDPEAYNNYHNYQLSYLADQMGETPEIVKSRLKAVGAEMVKIAVEEYPEAILWFTFTGIGAPVQFSKISGARELRTPSFIVLGMLEEARETRANLTIISGGEVSLGYCYESFGDLKNAIENRKQKYAPFLADYPHLRLAGTIAPWADARKKNDWTLKGKCGKAQMQNLVDFKPLIRELLRSYDYVWIYAAGAAGYNPYDSATSWAYTAALREIYPLPESK